MQPLGISLNFQRGTPKEGRRHLLNVNGSNPRGWGTGLNEKGKYQKNANIPPFPLPGPPICAGYSPRALTPQPMELQPSLYITYRGCSSSPGNMLRSQVMLNFSLKPTTVLPEDPDRVELILQSLIYSPHVMQITPSAWYCNSLNVLEYLLHSKKKLEYFIWSIPFNNSQNSLSRSYIWSYHMTDLQCWQTDEYSHQQCFWLSQALPKRGSR